MRPGEASATVDAGPAEWTAAALEGIDDEFVLIEGQLVTVAALWRTVLRSVIDGPVATTVLVCPSWWPASRIEVVTKAARELAAEVVVARRAALIEPTGEPNRVVVEIAAQWVAISSPEDFENGGRPMQLEWRATEPGLGTDDGAESVARAVAAACAGSAKVLVDAPAGVAGAGRLAAMIADRVRAAGTPAVVIADDRILRAGIAQLAGPDRAGADDPAGDAHRPPARHRRSTVAVLAGALASVAAIGGALVAGRGDHRAPDPKPAAGSAAEPTTILVEGRVAVSVPQRWTARRVTSGAGSARVEVVSPGAQRPALYLTQSRLPSGQTLADTAATLRRALDDQPQGVFGDFNPADQASGRPAVTYREMRGDHEIRWTVLVDGSVRISIGCRRAAPSGDRSADVAPGFDPCAEAIRSAHALG